MHLQSSLAHAVPTSLRALRRSLPSGSSPPMWQRRKAFAHVEHLGLLQDLAHLGTSEVTLQYQRQPVH